MFIRRYKPFVTSILVHYSIFQYVYIQKPLVTQIPIEVILSEKLDSKKIISKLDKKSLPKLVPEHKKTLPKLDLLPSSVLPNGTGPKQLDVAKKTQSGIGSDTQHIFDTDKELYASFFDRIHNQLDVVWHSKVKPYIHTYQTKNGVRIASKRTKLLITLDSVGHVLSVKVLLESNSDIIDAFATNSFKELAFFPNPPKELIKNGVIEFDWDFVIL